MRSYADTPAAPALILSLGFSHQDHRCRAIGQRRTAAAVTVACLDQTPDAALRNRQASNTTNIVVSTSGCLSGGIKAVITSSCVFRLTMPERHADANGALMHLAVLGHAVGFRHLFRRCRPSASQ
ncbi:hypothetical protein ACLK19_15490 [Escherichia coli]